MQEKRCRDARCWYLGGADLSWELVRWDIRLWKPGASSGHPDYVNTGRARVQFDPAQKCPCCCSRLLLQPGFSLAVATCCNKRTLHLQQAASAQRYHTGLRPLDVMSFGASVFGGPSSSAQASSSQNISSTTTPGMDTGMTYDDEDGVGTSYLQPPAYTRGEKQKWSESGRSLNIAVSPGGGQTAAWVVKRVSLATILVFSLGKS